MAGPGEACLLLAENFFSVAQFANHVISADEEPGGFEAFHVGNGRRHPADRWQAATANADHRLKSRNGQLRAADCLVIDRASNHLGKRFLLETSADDFVTPHTVLDITIPTVPGGQPADALGCVTDEGVWIKTFPAEGAYDWGLTSKAMGAGIVPQLTGVWLGKAWQPVNFLVDFPGNDETYQVTTLTTTSPYGWRGRLRPARPHTGTLQIRPGDEQEYDAIRYQILGLMGAFGYSAWLCHDKLNAGRQTVLVQLPDSTPLDFGKPTPAPRPLSVQYIEDQPLP